MARSLLKKSLIFAGICCKRDLAVLIRCLAHMSLIQINTKHMGQIDLRDETLRHDAIISQTCLSQARV